jgi:hypothetical protein
MKGCLYILAILLCTVAAMLFVSAAYAYAASMQWSAMWQALVAAAFCVGTLLFTTAKL